MRIERSIYSVLIIIASLVAVINWRKAALFKMDNDELREQVQALQVEVETAARLSEIANSNSEKSRQQITELMQLRNEVTQLRSQSKTAEALSAENEKLKTQLAVSRTITSPGGPESNGRPAERDTFPRESWTFAGFASPEDAMISAIWAMKEGDRARYLESLTPQEQERMMNLWSANDGGASVDEKHRTLTATINGLKILERQSLSPTEVLMNVFIEGQGRVEKVRMNQVGQEWKFGGFIREAQQRQNQP